MSEELQDGWNQTAPANGSYSINLGSGEMVPGLDFGNARRAEENLTIFGRTYEDSDKDGIMDDDESGLEGWTVNLMQKGEIIKTATTDVNGDYSFIGLKPGEYTLSEKLQDGWNQSSPLNNEHRITLSLQDYSGEADFGNYKIQGGGIDIRDGIH